MNTRSRRPSALPPLRELEDANNFLHRHLGSDGAEQAAMLAALGYPSLAAFLDATLPESIRVDVPPRLPEPLTEGEALARLREMAQRNGRHRSLIGQGYYGTITPAPIRRHVLENAAWYTAYTPYQAEISQGRLEALLNFQRVIMDLTGFDLANASLLDEATAAAEAMAMARRINTGPGKRFFVDQGCFPQTLDVLRTRAQFQDIELVVAHPEQVASLGADCFGVLLQYPDDTGEVRSLGPLIEAAKGHGATVIVASDPLALVLLQSPAALGADMAIGSAQRLGVPPGFGGPHAAFLAARSEYRRAMPGRIIGVSRDSRGRRALRMALQTREQHIRREKANSNLCTAQVLLANMAGLYAVYHGPDGLRAIAGRVHRLAALFAQGLRHAGIPLLTRNFFDTLQFDVGARAKSLLQQTREAGYNLRAGSIPGMLSVSFDECCSREDVQTLLKLVAGVSASLDSLDRQAPDGIPQAFWRQDAILTHPVFHRYHSEQAMTRYLRQLADQDLALDRAMIPLGSCTMKLNAASAMTPITWPEFAELHPFVPVDQAAGYLAMIQDLESWLATLTGFDRICLQPNSGAQGEYAGLSAIRRYQRASGQGHRDICLIPRSAHGTNPASAQMCGLTVVPVECDSSGNVQTTDLLLKLTQHRDRLSCLMITYPSTHGVFEESIKSLCAQVHRHGGQVYLDGANLNALVGLSTPGDIGADVAHINLHKTFSIPHGGGGPGVGPIGLKAHLAPFAPNHPIQPVPGPHQGQGAVAAAPWGSAGILPIAWMYIAMLGLQGLRRATQTAILHANYVAQALAPHYPVLYTGRNGRVAHECILDLRPLKATSGISELDVAKRLMDYGFHAPTVSFPVPGTLMVEPTESEPKAELDRFITAMIAIREEIRRVESGHWPREDNPLKRAPHTQADLAEATWTLPYSREEAVFPLASLRENKYWPPVNRIDDVYGDRHLDCGLGEAASGTTPTP